MPLINSIYQTGIFLILYKLYKILNRIVTGTTELFRICDAEGKRIVRAAGGAGSEKVIGSGQKGLDSVALTSAATALNPMTVYRIERSAHCTILRRSVSIIVASYKLMHDLNARAATKFDSTNKAHERKLLELWDYAMPNEKLKARISDQWGKIGFQGLDPATDFRGMGMLSLDDLHYFARIHPKIFQRVLESSHHETEWFSMAIVGINITSFVISLVRTRQLQYYFYTYGTTKESYQEFYCFVFDAFEKEWTHQVTPLTVMDFNRVFGDVQGKIEKLLLEGHPTILASSSIATKKKE
ncbi:ELMO domain-containing protein 2 [Irineochytrium annulatum]|nr:ELMO domain-containing protein 2 [Irineochytrium annulatum]